MIIIRQYYIVEGNTATRASFPNMYVISFPKLAAIKIHIKIRQRCKF